MLFEMLLRFSLSAPVACVPETVSLRSFDVLFRPDAFKVDISLKDIKDGAPSLPLSASLLLSFLVLKVFSSICPLMLRLLQRLSPCIFSPPAVVRHTNASEDA